MVKKPLKPTKAKKQHVIKTICSLSKNFLHTAQKCSMNWKSLSLLCSAIHSAVWPKHLLLTCGINLDILFWIHSKIDQKQKPHNVGKIALESQAAQFNQDKFFFMGARTSTDHRIRSPTSWVQFHHLNGVINHSAIRALSSSPLQPSLFEQQRLFWSESNWKHSRQIVGK